MTMIMKKIASILMATDFSRGSCRVLIMMRRRMKKMMTHMGKILKTQRSG